MGSIPNLLYDRWSVTGQELAINVEVPRQVSGLLCSGSVKRSDLYSYPV